MAGTSVVFHPTAMSYDWTINHRPPRTQTRTIILVIADVAGAILSLGILAPSELAIFSEDHGSSWHRAGAISSGIGSGISWSVLTYYGLSALIHEALANKSQVEIILFRDDTPKAAKNIMIGVSIALALASRVVSVTEGVFFTRHKTDGLVIGIASGIAEAGLPAYGLLRLLTDIVKKLRQYQAPQVDKKVEKVREHLLQITNRSTLWAMRVSQEERETKFKIFYQQQNAQTLQEIKQQWSQLLEAMTDIFQENAHHMQCSENFVRKYPRLLIQSASVSSAIPLFAMDAMLAVSAYSLVKANENLQTLGGCFAFIPLLYVVPKMIGQASGRLFDFPYDICGGERSDKTFADQFYPKLAGMMKLAATFLSVLQFDEQIALSKKYTKEGTWEYDFLSIGNIVACSFLISASYYMLIDDLFELFALSDHSDPDIRNAAVIKQHLDRVREAFEKMSPDNLVQMLNSIEDEELKLSILNNQLSLEELTKMMGSLVREDTPLLAPV